MGVVLPRAPCPRNLVGRYRLLALNCANCTKRKGSRVESLDGEGGFKNFLWVPMGRGEWQWYTVHLLSQNEWWCFYCDTEALRLVHR